MTEIKSMHRIAAEGTWLNGRMAEAERVLVDSAKKLVGIYEQKTRDCIAKVWGEK